jgi:ketosteroid isomerase-like protein
MSAPLSLGRIRWGVCSSIIVLAFANAWGQPPSIKDEVRRAEEEYRTAVLRNDWPYFQSHLSPDYVGVDSDGTVSGASELLASRKAGSYRVRKIDVVHQDIYLSGDTAVVSECLKVDALKSDKKIPTDIQVSRVWRQIGGKWLVLALQVTPRTSPCHP